MNLICDTDIISSLAKIDELCLLDELFSRSEKYIPLGVYEELEFAQDVGYDFPEKIFKSIPIVSMSTEEIDDYRKSLTKKRELGKGEIQCMVIARKRDWTLLINDRLARKKCKENQINTYDLAEILRASYLAGIRSKPELGDMVTALKEKDNFIFSNETDLYK